MSEEKKSEDVGGQTLRDSGVEGRGTSFGQTTLSESKSLGNIFVAFCKLERAVGPGFFFAGKLSSLCAEQ